MPQVKLIYAQAANGVIGQDHQLPWYLPEDLEWFKQHTLDQVVVMGRKTFESLPDTVRPLPRRDNIVLSRDPYFSLKQLSHPRLRVFDDFYRVLNAYANQPIWVIGGAQLFELALPFATELYVTEILQDYEGDTYAPKLDPMLFQLHHYTEVQYSPKARLLYVHKTYKKRVM